MKENSGDSVRFGFWVYLMSDCVLFASLFATFAVLREATFGGPTAADLFNAPFVLTETLLLLTSSFTMGLALLAAATPSEVGKTWPSGPERRLTAVWRRRESRAIALLLATLLLGLAFLGMELSEFWHLIESGEGPSRSAFLSSFFTLVGTHGLHVFFGALWMVVLMAGIFLRGLTHAVLRRLMLLSLFWHFLDLIWIFIFTFVYLLPSL